MEAGAEGDWLRGGGGLPLAVASVAATEAQTSLPVATVLEARGISVNFGGVRALDDLSLTVEPGKISSLIGPNGSGKTTTFNVISGFRHPDGGEVYYRGERVTMLAPHQIARRGVVRTFQQARVFSGVTVLECVLMGAYLRSRSSLWGALARTATTRRLEGNAVERAAEILEFLGLLKPDEMAGILPYGEQKLLEIGIALAASPAVLLLDEPAAGMNLEERKRLVDILRRLAERGVTVLLVEHNMNLVMDISHRVFVLNFGRKIAEGTPATIARHPEVIKAYLGEGFRSSV
jgi:branched-chain amino acid transport system ATP-binding protein